MARKVLTGIVLVLALAFAPIAESAPDFRSFIGPFYQYTFGRVASETELSAWENYLSANPNMVGAESMALWLFGQPESRNRPTTPWMMVWDLYEAVLGRAPSSEELGAWASGYIAASNGAISSLITSPEFWGRFPDVRDPGTASGIVIGLYRVVLGREPSAAEVSAWADYLVAGGDAEEVALGFLNSVEYLGTPRTTDQHVATLYHALLWRDPNPEEANAWTTYFTNWIAATEQVFITSAEFQARFQGMEVSQPAPSVVVPTNPVVTTTDPPDTRPPVVVPTNPVVTTTDPPDTRPPVVVPINPVITTTPEPPDTRPRADIGTLWNIGPDVPPDQVRLINQGLTIAQGYLERNLGGGISEQVRRTIEVKVVATGRGNEEPGFGGGCCTSAGAGANGASMIRLFFDVRHPNWREGVEGQKIAAHEHTHAWQYDLGCITPFNIALGRWLTEGIAEYLASHAAIEAGGSLYSGMDLISHAIEAARNTGQLSVPLREFEAGFKVWSGDVGFLAVDYIVHRTPRGIMALRTMCEEVATGSSLSDAFPVAFGIGLRQFYEEFDGLYK